MDEAAAAMSELSGSQIQARFRSEEEIVNLADSNPFVWTQRWQVESGTMVDMEECKGYGLPLTTFKTFLERNEGALKGAVSP